MRRNTAIIVGSWSHPSISEIRDDCMVKISDGVYFHHRLQSVIVVRNELPNGIANALPKD